MTTTSVQNRHVASTRNTNVEILRFVLMVFIFFWHLIVHGLDMRYIGQQDFTPPIGISIHLLVFLECLFVPSVYCFLMITGYYGLRFTLKKLLSLVLVCSLASWALSAIKFTYKPLTLELITHTFFPLSSNRWWFMTLYVILFILSPILNKGIEYLNRTQLKTIILLLVIYQSLSLTSLELGSGSSLQGFITMYLIGRYCAIYGIGQSAKTIKIVYLACFAVLFILCFSIIEWLPKYQSYQFLLMAYANILITTMAVCIFLIINSINPTYNTTINKCLRPTLFIYLFTEGMGSLFYKAVVGIFQSNVILGVGATIAILACSLFAGYVLQNIADMVCRTRLVQHFIKE